MITGAEELPALDKNKFVIKVSIQAATEQKILLLAFEKKEIATALVTQLNSKNDFNQLVNNYLNISFTLKIILSIF